MAKLYSTLLLAVLLAHATARNIPTDEVTNPNPTNALAPVQNTENVATIAGAPAGNGAVDDQKNFITYGGVGGWGGVGGYVGVLPVFGGIGGIGGAGGLGGLGGVGGLGGIGGLGKVGGIGVGGGVGGLGGVGGIIP